MAKKASSRRLGDLVKRARPEAGEDVKGGKSKFKSATIKSASARASARRSRPD